MIIIAGIVAIICVNNGNIGGAIVALGIGCILHIFDGGSDDN